jgi:hypothetical protein
LVRRLDPTEGLPRDAAETAGRCDHRGAAAVYKRRWQVELFTALKQNLRVKTLVGTSANALKIRVRTAFISILLLKFRQLRSRLGWSLSRLVDWRFPGEAVLDSSGSACNLLRNK